MTPEVDARPQSAAAPSFAEAVRTWAQIGLIGFGGPAGQIALMHRILVVEKRWISEARFLHALSFCMLLPGPEAQQLATYVGWLLHRTRGGVVAGVLFVLPGFLVILALSTLYVSFQESAWLADIFFGLNAAVIAIVAEAVIRVGRRAVKTPAAMVLAAAAFVGIFALGIPFPVIVLGAGLIGYVAASFAPGLFGDGGHASAADPDDRLADPAHHPSLARTIGMALFWAVLWAAPVLLCGAIFGWDSIYAGLGAFFSHMAVVTFGGAYAVLAYVADAAVTSFGWLRPEQMIDGLALAETTPGPLILVLTFVGFVAAFAEPGAMTPLAGAILGAALTTWVTFVPSFLWIFVGAPYVERLRGNRHLAAALSAITAAVVGVILNLAVFLGLHVLFGEVGQVVAGPVRMDWPVWSTLDPWAFGLVAVAGFLLLRTRFGILATLALTCGLGFLVRTLAA